MKPPVGAGRRRGERPVPAWHSRPGEHAPVASDGLGRSRRLPSKTPEAREAGVGGVGEDN